MKYDQFGAMGSAFSLGGSKVTPPFGMCIVAIQFLADNILTELTAIPPIGEDVEYIGDAVVAHNGPVTTKTTAGAPSVPGGVITLSSLDTAIKVGQKVTGTGIPTTGGDVTVLKYDGAVAIQLSRGVPAIAGGTTLSFHAKGGSGSGGETTNAAVFPKGLTIYGRWDSVTCTADANGGIITYFGTK
jgi:hypothetical protein